jgi:tetratricopeptide (TPR) repeat protein
LESAEYHYKKSIEIYPHGYAAHQNLAVVYDLKNDFDNAVREYETMKNINPNNPEAYYGLANLYLHNRLFEKALIEGEKGLELYLKSNHPYKSDAQFQIGIIYYYMNNKSRAREFFKLAKSNGARIPEKIASEFRL